MKKIYIGLLFFLLFFASGAFTLGDYGISWDSPVHFRRGQTYLHYFLTGRTDFGEAEQKSFYQVNDVLHTGKNLKDLDMGHPPLSDILSAVSNYIFHQKLGWLGDIEAHNLFIVFSGALTVFFVALFAYETFGLTAAVFSSLFLGLYPLFWSESHFNIKDPPQTAFFTGALYFFWKAYKDKKPFYLIGSSLLAGAGLAVKFNMLFAVFIIIPWILYIILTNGKKLKNFLLSKKTMLVLLIAPAIILGVLYLSWPYLWNDPVFNFLKTITYYRSEGTNIIYQPLFVRGQLNFYPLAWIFLTTPPVILLFLFLGTAAFRILKKNEKEVYVLWLLWLLAPIARVSFSKFAVYGGVRQIMEFIPAMALIAGLGVHLAVRKLGKFKFVLLAAVLVLLVYPLIRLHPNENVYFNFLAGGVKGAFDKNIPAAGNTFGNAYKYLIKWVNENAPNDSKLALVQGATSNLPLFELRRDIDYSNAHFSGIERNGEYLMDVTYLSETKDYHYAWEYIDKFLEPVYEYKVDGVAVAKIWRNDLENTYEHLRRSEVPVSEYKIKPDGTALVIELTSEVELTGVTINFLDYPCDLGQPVFVETSSDALAWTREKDALPSSQAGRKSNVGEKGAEFYFAGRQAKFIRFIPNGKSSCFSSARFPRVEIRKLSGSNR